MNILLLTHSFNSLTQRLFVELRALGHDVTVEFDICDAVSEEAVAMARPDVVIAPFLKRAIPESIWSRHVCLVVHPGIIGDRGPSALDWAIQEGEPEWGVTVLQANAEMDAGDIWAHAEFPMRPAKKSSLYRNEVTDAAVRAVHEAIDKFATGSRPLPLREAAQCRGRERPLVRQTDRTIDWCEDSTVTVLAKIRAADGFPGVLDSLFDIPCFLYDAHPASAAALAAAPGTPGQVVARREHAVLRRTRDGGVWIGHARPVQQESDSDKPFKLPVAEWFSAPFAALPELPVPLMRDAGEWGECRYEEEGGVGYLAFDCYNGAMSTAQCNRVREAVAFAKQRDTRVLVLLGGSDFFSNGIHLNRIEAGAHREGKSAADESWQNINAMNDLALEVLTATDRITISALRGNAGAGGVFLALAADHVVAHKGVVLNPHYKNMGNLYGSEYWTYLLPRRVGEQQARELMHHRLPMSADEALAMHLVDAILASDAGSLEPAVRQFATAIAADPETRTCIVAKRERRARDEAAKPLAAYREQELARMRRNFYGFDPSYHVARYHFVQKLPHAWTPRHLALHRDTITRTTSRDN